jgi:hypothetical protein
MGHAKVVSVENEQARVGGIAEAFGDGFWFDGRDFLGEEDYRK